MDLEREVGGIAEREWFPFNSHLDSHNFLSPKEAKAELAGHWPLLEVSVPSTIVSVSRS